MPRVPNARARTTASGQTRIQVSYYACGKRHQPWAPEGLTLTAARKWAQAQQWAAEHPDAAPKKAEPAHTGRTVAEVCREWLAWYKPTSRSRNTLDLYAGCVRRIVALLGDRPLADLTATDVEHARNHMLEGTWAANTAMTRASSSSRTRGTTHTSSVGASASALDTRRAPNAGYLPSTVRLTLGHLSTVCLWAMDEDRQYLTKNPVAKVLKASRGGPKAMDYQPLTTKDTKGLMGVLLRHAVPDDPDCPYACMLVLALSTGLRVKSEWGGAQWGDIDWSQGLFALQRSWDGHHQQINRQSNGKLHKRLIPLAPRAVDVLRAQWAWSCTRQRGSDPEAGAFVFTDWNGEMLSRRHLAELLDRYAWEAGIAREAGQHLTPHSLRHQAAIEALRASANPKAVQAMLGHSTIGMTLDLYAAFIPGMAETATAAVGGALFEARREQEAV